MARVGWQPHDQDREDQKAEEKAELRALRKEARLAGPSPDGPLRFEGLDPSDHEFDSVLDFVEFMLDDDQTEYDYRHLQCLNYRCGITHHAIRKELGEWGLTLKRRAVERRVRGFNANSHDRWSGPGSSPTHGGGGGDSLIGMS